ncbi:MAG: phage tail sheath monomer [Hyphomonadaceae bacterium]|nr:MAG: phage tail sheath monomer [Hyphomonadaceae bacterium]KAF0182677.1 MAG: phage tail sheath monomer [Hyphomonadaceae bacterium]
MTIHHGIKHTAQNTASRPIQTPSSAVIGLVATSHDADADYFPADRPVLVTNIRAAIAKAGTAGTLKKSLEAIADQTDPVLVVVRVPDTSIAPADDADIVGGTDVNGDLTGIQAFLVAETLLGVRPKILGAPGFSGATVTNALATVGEKLRAFVYAKLSAATIAAAVVAEGGFAQANLMPIWPDWTGFDGRAVATALGLRAKLDAEYGFVHKSLSNVAVNNISGIDKDITFNISGVGTDAATLNNANITTLIRRSGFRFWGNRTCSENTLLAFEVAVRTNYAIQDMIDESQATYIDTPMTIPTIKAILSGLNAKGRSMVSAGKIIGIEFWFDGALNPSADLAAGKAKISCKFTPVAPLESLEMLPEITTEYYLNFGRSLVQTA